MRLRVILIMAAVAIVLGVVYYFASRPEPPEPVEPRPFVWSVEMEELQHMKISLPKEDKSEAWVKHEDRYWYFDYPDGPKVNMKRWGGGIPLLLSGPGAERLITADSTNEQLEIYGLTKPNMLINLVVDIENVGEKHIDIEVGDNTLDGQGYYVKLVKSRDVYTVHHTWYEVLERLVLEPPYPVPEEEED